jgi:hypothetical protein
MDVRGIAFDSEHQRLYATDSFWARLMVFDFARAARDLSLPPFATEVYSTIDASVDDDYPPESGYAEIDLPVASAAVYSVTQNLLEQESMRESRMVVSEAAIAAVPPSTSVHLFVRNDESHETRFLIGNPSPQSSNLAFTFRDEGGERAETLNLTLVPGEQRRIGTRELLGDSDTRGLVTVDSTVPVTITALAEIRNARGELILSEAPRVADTPRVGNSSRVIPRIINGAGHRTRIRLMNPSDEPLAGRISFFTPTGEDGDSAVSYEIPAWGVYEYVSDPESAIARQSYASVIPEASAIPFIAAWTELWDGETLLSESRIDTSDARQRAWIPLNTLQTPTRHGEIEASITVANDNPVGASLRFILYAMDGTEADRYEMIIREHSQRELSLVQLFNIGQFKGTLHIFSDAPVSLHAGQTTINLRGESVAMRLPVFGPDSAGMGSTLDITDGRGFVTEILLVNTGDTMASGEFALRTSEGAPMSLPLR